MLLSSTASLHILLLFPTRRSSDLRHGDPPSFGDPARQNGRRPRGADGHPDRRPASRGGGARTLDSSRAWAVVSDRKSTRLNYSHLGISYAVLCLYKKICLRSR